jgi:hypothetical protein
MADGRWWGYGYEDSGSWEMGVVLVERSARKKQKEPNRKIATNKRNAPAISQFPGFGLGWS